MKKIQCRGIPLSPARQTENTSVCSVSFPKGVENRVTEHEIMPIMRNNESLEISHSNYADENTTTCVINNKKKEKFGIFSNLRRRIRSNFNRKTEETEKNIEESRNSVGAKCETKRQKQTAKCRLNLCSKPSNSNSSQSTESLDLNMHLQRKLDDNLWSNKDRKEDGSKKEKASCRTKDISKFQTACRVPCTCSTSRNRGAENSFECKDCVKINNVSPTFPATRLEISVLCHSNGINSSSTSAVNYHHEYKNSILEGAILHEVPNTWSLTHELFRLSKFGWYWGPITRREAERKLNGQPDGAFLVRDSSDERYLLSLSFRSYGKTLHTRIEHCNGKFIFDAQPDTEGYPSIVDLIENSMNDPQTGICSYSRRGSPSPPIYPVRLTKPVSRFTQVRSLQYMCRFVIRQYTRYDHIQQLPLPKKLKGWIGENQY